MKFGLLPILILFSLSNFAFADEDCKDEYWTLKGSVKKEVQKFDALVKGLSSSKDAINEINEFLKKHGLPQRLGIGAEGKISYTNRVEGEEDSPGGPVAIVFLKTMAVKSDSGLSFDMVYEVDSLDAAKASKIWEIPKDSAPDAIDGDEIILADSIASICGTDTKSVGVAIKPDASYRVIDYKAKNTLKRIPNDKCKAAKNVFENSDYSYCAEFTDLKSKKKRILIWELPMT